MDTLFRRTKAATTGRNRTSNSSASNQASGSPNLSIQSTSEFGISPADFSPTALTHSIPYDQLPQNGEPPKPIPVAVAGPGPQTLASRSSMQSYTSSSAGSYMGRAISSPNTNPGLTNQGTEMNLNGRRRESAISTTDSTTSASMHRRPSNGSIVSNSTLTRQTSNRMLDPLIEEASFNRHMAGVRAGTPNGNHGLSTGGGGRASPASFDTSSHRTFSESVEVNRTNNGLPPLPSIHRSDTEHSHRSHRSQMSTAPSESASASASASSTRLPPVLRPDASDLETMPPPEEIERIWREEILPERAVGSAEGPLASTSAAMNALGGNSAGGMAGYPKAVQEAAQNVAIGVKWAMIKSHRMSQAQTRSSDPTGSRRKGDAGTSAGNQDTMGTPKNSGGSNVPASQKHPPEWWVQKLQEGLQNGELDVGFIGALTTEVRTCGKTAFNTMISLQIIPVLATALSRVNSRGSFPSKRNVDRPSGNRPLTADDLRVEQALLRCFKSLLDAPIGIQNTISQPNVGVALVGSLVSPKLSNRKLASDYLVFLLHQDKPVGYEYVLQSFYSHLKGLALEEAPAGIFDVWMKSLITTLDGRGRLGSLVGATASRGQGTESELIEYCRTSMLFINAILRTLEREDEPMKDFPDLLVRTKYRQELIRCGVKDVMARLEALLAERIDANDTSLAVIEREIESFKELEIEDEKATRQMQDRIFLKDFKSIDQIVRALNDSLEGTKAQQFFLATLRSLILIKDNGDDRVRYFELIESLVSGVVMDGRAGMIRDFESIGQVSVQRVLNRFADIDRMERDEAKIRDLHAQNFSLQTENERLRTDMSKSGGDAASKLRDQLARTEESLKLSRANAKSSETEMERMRSAYEQRIAELEAIIAELLSLAEGIFGISGRQNEEFQRRYERLQDKQKLSERGKAKAKLEGRKPNGDKNTASENTESADETDTDVNAEAAIPGATKPQPSKKSVERSEVVSGSQFADVDDEKLTEHIQTRLLDEESTNVNIPRSARTRNMDLARIAIVDGKPAIEPKSPKRYAHLGKLTPGYSNLASELQARTGLIMRSVSAPSHLHESAEGSSSVAGAISQTEGVQDNTSTTKAASAFASEPASRAQGLKKPSDQSLVNTDTKKTGEDGTKGHPPPPPPPPMPDWLNAARLPASEIPTGDLREDSSAPPHPPPPPPPPPMAGMSGMGALLSSIAGGANLRKRSDNHMPGGAITNPAFRRASKRISFAPTRPSENRKEVAITASRKMKQLQWEKVNKAKVDSTVWGEADEIIPSDTVAEQLKRVDVWSEMEDEFKAREIAFNALAKKQKEELKSVLAPSVRKHVEILMARTKRMDPEELCDRIRNFDPELCDTVFLSELSVLLPTPEQVSLLKQQNAETPEQILLLHPADRLMIRLIKIPRLADRLKGMLYKVSFDENSNLLEKGTELLLRACEDLRNARQFKALLNVILMMGNFMNGTNYGGGAYGFKISSINRLVDTKSTNGQNLLHFLERTVTQHFPAILDFRQELEKPAEAYRVSYEELSSGTRDLRNNLAKIQRDMEAEVENLERSDWDNYLRRMSTFVSIAEERVQDLSERLSAAGHAFNSVKAYYGEGDDRFNPDVRAEIFSRPTSLEFFGVFKTFVTSWDLCRLQNKARDEARQMLERRKISTGASTSTVGGGGLDDLHARLLKQGTPRAKRADRRRHDLPRTPDIDQFDFSSFSIDGFGDDTTGDQLAEAARNMLGQLGGSVDPPAVPALGTGRTRSRSSMGSRTSLAFSDLGLNDSPPRISLNGFSSTPTRVGGSPTELSTPDIEEETDAQSAQDAEQSASDHVTSEQPDLNNDGAGGAEGAGPEGGGENGEPSLRHD